MPLLRSLPSPPKSRVLGLMAVRTLTPRREAPAMALSSQESFRPISEIPPPDINIAYRDGDDGHRRGVERVGQKLKRHPVAFGNAGDRQVGRGADQGAVAA